MKGYLPLSSDRPGGRSGSGPEHRHGHQGPGRVGYSSSESIERRAARCGARPFRAVVTRQVGRLSPKSRCDTLARSAGCPPYRSPPHPLDVQRNRAHWAEFAAFPDPAACKVSFSQLSPRSDIAPVGRSLGWLTSLPCHAKRVSARLRCQSWSIIGQP